uniref:SKIP_SNW domain-containing protein n=1 Tax=Rhabditophanes sp. KR3021 TaxID=114890 RepID=A0AC35UGB0_9BILA
MSAKLSDILPKVTEKPNDFYANTVTKDGWFKDNEKELLPVVTQHVRPYGQRKNMVPRSQEDFGDGGAFPECLIPQFPRGMGKDEVIGQQPSKQLALQTDENGKVGYDAIARLGHAKNKIIHTRVGATKSKHFSPEDEDVQKPSTEEMEETIEKTRKMIEKITQSKISSALPVKHAERPNEASYIRYTPSSQQKAITGQAPQQKIIKIVEEQKDPMAPPAFKINQKMPRGPPSPPAPVLHSPTRKPTAKEQADWKIPPCVSNYKNPRGHVIELSKRLASDGHGLSTPQINDKFSIFAEALYITERVARESIEQRVQLERRLAQNEKMDQEAAMRKMAQEAREERKNIKQEFGDADEDAAERDEIRRERKEQHRKETAIARNHPDKLERMRRENERDISEKIALGLPNTRAGNSNAGETQFDSRLFGKSSGLDAGGTNDETYAVYDKPWKPLDNIQKHIYRPTKNKESAYAEDADQIANTDRFVPSQSISGADASTARSGPVQFEKASDIFGLSNLFDTAPEAPVKEKRHRDDYNDRGESPPRSKKSRHHP